MTFSLFYHVIFKLTFTKNNFIIGTHTISDNFGGEIMIAIYTRMTNSS